MSDGAWNSVRPTVWTSSMFVVPATKTGKPVVMTTVSPSTTYSRFKASSIAASTASSVVENSFENMGRTPHISESARHVDLSGVDAIIVALGLYLLTMEAVLPLLESDMTAAADRPLATVIAAWLTESAVLDENMSWTSLQ